MYVLFGSLRVNPCRPNPCHEASRIRHVDMLPATKAALQCLGRRSAASIPRARIVPASTCGMPAIAALPSRPFAAGSRGISTLAGAAPRRDGPVDHVGSKGLLEYSVVYTDRATNLMSASYGDAARDLEQRLCTAYNAESVVVMPGSGTTAMESVAWAFGSDRKALVVRNGFFSYRWSDISASADIFGSETVWCAEAQPTTSGDATPTTGAASLPAFAPPAIEDLEAAIAAGAPDVVFAPHVETSTGMLLPDAYVARAAKAAKAAGALFVLDGIASGALWVDMAELGVDAYITAPQKGWSAPAGCGVVALGPRGREAVEAAATEGRRVSYACSLPKWLAVRDAYASGGFMYHATPPTDAILQFHAAVVETQAAGAQSTRAAMVELGNRVRAGLAERGFPSVAAPGFEAPGVVVVYSDVKDMVAKFKARGIQVAGGVPWQIGESAAGVDAPAQTFRLGLFGLDKLAHLDRTVSTLLEAVDDIVAAEDDA